jgi:hypothetical protein
MSFTYSYVQLGVSLRNIKRLIEKFVGFCTNEQSFTTATCLTGQQRMLIPTWQLFLPSLCLRSVLPYTRLSNCCVWIVIKFNTLLTQPIDTAVKIGSTWNFDRWKWAVLSIKCHACWSVQFKFMTNLQASVTLGVYMARYCGNEIQINWRRETIDLEVWRFLFIGLCLKI